MRVSGVVWVRHGHGRQNLPELLRPPRPPPPSGIMKLLGHRDFRMTLRYTQIVDETIGREYFEAMSRIAERYQLRSGDPTDVVDRDPVALVQSLISWITKNLCKEGPSGHKARLLARRPVAAISGGDILNLSGGTVFGQVLADPSATASVYPSVTFRIAGTGVQTVPDPVNFEMAFVKLQGMSSSLRNAPTGTVGVKNSVMTLTSTIPNANPQIFDISGSMFGNYGYNVTSMVFVGVPDTATVVINVSGTSISISNTGITGLPGYNGTIWNFYEATNVNLASVGIVGSILAPFANVHATSGFVTGTVAAWSFGGKWAESHYGRFHNNALVTGS